MSEVSKPDGIYTLPQDLKNPDKIDRRFKNWCNQEVIKAGTRFELKTQDSGKEREGFSVSYQTLKMVPGYDSISPHTYEKLFPALLEVLQGEPETLGSILHKAGIGITRDRTQAVLGFLLDAGKVTLEDVKEALVKEEATDEEPWYEHLRKHGLGTR